ncbi:hypothetical protein HII36_11805 [Nonomuraea sp. NN258]|uniref:hypothetical protein n=1 Tax=Nonomuraea antri TaxID=2730852 RepID=UPI001568C791|nr:hypothetical protein [Nonomuraea antri]NRQ32518.1 hypothetical protein [Nonomuraea antri]
MDFWGAVLVLFRRWYVTFPMFLLTLGGTYAVYTSVPTLYVSNAVLVLTMPTTGGTQPAEPGKRLPHTNPLLNFDWGLNMTATILIQALNTPDTTARLGVVPGGDVSYVVSNGNTNPETLATGPFVFIEGKGPTPQAAESVVRRVIGRADVELAERQRWLNAPVPTYISAHEMVRPTIAQAQRTSKLRAAAAAGLLGGMGSLGAAFATESVIQALRRRRRRREQAAEAEQAAAAATRESAEQPEQPGDEQAGQRDADATPDERLASPA